MRHLGATGYIMETGKNEYRPTNFSLCLSLPFMYGGYISLCVLPLRMPLMTS